MNVLRNTMVEVAFANGVPSCAWFTPRASSPESSLYSKVEELINIGSGSSYNNLELALTRPPSQTISLLSWQSNKNKVSEGVDKRLQNHEPDIKKIERCVGHI